MFGLMSSNSSSSHKSSSSSSSSDVLSYNFLFGFLIFFALIFDKGAMVDFGFSDFLVLRLSALRFSKTSSFSFIGDAVSISECCLVLPDLLLLVVFEGPGIGDIWVIGIDFLF